jgi:hypothetical protein
VVANELGNGDRRKETFQLMDAEEEGRHKFADRIATISSIALAYVCKMREWHGMSANVPQKIDES